jgi:hypothetical protein
MGAYPHVEIVFAQDLQVGDVLTTTPDGSGINGSPLPIVLSIHDETVTDAGPHVRYYAITDITETPVVSGPSTTPALEIGVALFDNGVNQGGSVTYSNISPLIQVQAVVGDILKLVKR